MSSSFYDRYFYPALHTPEVMESVRADIPRQLWPLIMDIGAMSQDALKITNCISIGQQPISRLVVLANKSGIPVLTLQATLDGKPQYTVNNWHRHLKNRGKQRYTVSTSNRQYLLKVLRPHIEPMLTATENEMKSQLVRACQSFNTFLNEETQNAGRISEQIINPDLAYAALRTIYEKDFSLTQISTEMQAAMQKIYDDLVIKFTKKKDYKTRLLDMYAQPKWVIGVTTQLGAGYPLAIGSAAFKATAFGGAGSYKFDIEKPLRLYRDLEHFYAENPDDADSLKTALTFCKIHREKDPAQVKSYDNGGFLPCHYRSIYEDVCGISFCDEVRATVTKPHWLLLGK